MVDRINEIPLTNRHNKKKEKVGQAVSVSRGIDLNIFSFTGPAKAHHNTIIKESEPWLYRSTLRREVLLEMKVDRVRPEKLFL